MTTAKPIAAPTTIKRGSVITGRFKIPRDESFEARMEVVHIFDLSYGAGQKETYFFGWFSGSSNKPRIVAVNVKNWFSFSVKVESGVSVQALPGNWHVSRGNELFAFIEDVPLEDVESAKSLGASRITDISLKSYTYPTR